MKYCKNCKQEMEPENGWNWLGVLICSIFLFGLEWGWIVGMIIVLYCWSAGLWLRCPICKAKNWEEENNKTTDAK